MSPAAVTPILQLNPFPLEAPDSRVPTGLASAVSPSVEGTPTYKGWSGKLAGMVDRYELTAGTAKQYRAEGLHFLCYLLRTNATPDTLQNAWDSSDPSQKIDTLLIRLLGKIDLEQLVTYFRHLEAEGSRSAVHGARSVLVNHFLPWAHRVGLTDFNVKEYDRRSFRLEHSLDDHMVRRNELLLMWGEGLDRSLSEDTAQNYRAIVRRYLRYLREHHLDTATRKRVESGELHPSRALNDLILKDPFERVRDFLKTANPTIAEHCRSIILNDFYPFLHGKGLTKFDSQSYPRGTFFPDLPLEEAIVRESRLLKAWAEHVRADPSFGEGAAENYVRIVARYMFYVRDTEMMVPRGRKGTELNTSIRDPEKALERYVSRLAPEERLVGFLHSLESDRSYEALRWLLADKFYSWLAEQDTFQTTFDRQKFERLMAA